MQILRFNHFFINESVSNYFHASVVEFPSDTILVGGNEHKMKTSRVEEILDQEVISGHIPMSESIFFCKDMDTLKNVRDIDQSYIFDVTPVGQVREYDINWLYIMQEELNSGSEDNLKSLSRSYWNGDKTDEPIMVYTASEVIING